MQRAPAICHLATVPTIGYLGYTAVGPYPVLVAGIQLDILLGAITCISLSICISLEPHKRVSPNEIAYIAAILLYLITSTLATVLSNDLVSSKNALIASTSYALSSILIPIAYKHNFDILRKLSVLAATIVGAFFIYRYLNTGWNSIESGRFVVAAEAISSSQAGREGIAKSDPNTTAIGLMLFFAISLIDLQKHNRDGDLPKLALAILCSSTIFSASLLFSSRTPIVAIILSLLTCLIVQTLQRPPTKLPRLRSLLVAIIPFSIAAFILLTAPNLLLSLVFRISNAGTSTDSHRIDLISSSLAGWLEDTTSFLLGRGYFVENPHNEILRALYGSGIIGASSLFLVLFIVYLSFVHRAPRQSKPPLLIIFFFLIISSQTYFLVKPLWIGLAFIIGSSVGNETQPNTKDLSDTKRRPLQYREYRQQET
ncbi:hypothetical protein [Pelagicoccus sp. SDUM812003]|uniref:O-antigen ligase family protein n=1 Tax=Pelagicoccus sp. SDUM812003 TaxID=3041267 RepID=UPI00280F4201|nr:hypothetical protein [Pelagicoccus sp. SDUM812003]MDQ8205601.1 hypothetical protein [Pelagicoccus sp. SDUM812003]